MIKKCRYIFCCLVLMIMLGCQELPDLGHGYRIVYNARHDRSIYGPRDTYVIYGHVLDYSWDSTFIIASEKPRDSVPECAGKIPDMTYNKCNEAFERSTFRQFWIINKKEKNEYTFDTLSKLARYSNVYGPFKYVVYLQKRKEIGVPDALKLKTE